MRKVPGTFPDQASYGAAFEPLLLEEVRASVQQGLQQLGSLEVYEVQLVQVSGPQPSDLAVTRLQCHAWLHARTRSVIASHSHSEIIQ